MAYVEHPLLGYVNNQAIQTITAVASHKVRVYGHPDSETDKWYFRVVLARFSVNSADYDSEGDATTARTALISALGI